MALCINPLVQHLAFCSKLILFPKLLNMNESELTFTKTKMLKG